VHQHGDWHKPGGHVLLDVDGAVRCIYRSSEPANRPSVDEILNQISP
jgi:hypothetical protein